MGVLGVLGCPNPYPSQTPARIPPNSPGILFFSRKMAKQANQEKSEKPSLPKTTFFTQFSGFPSFLFPIFINFGSILGLPGGCFLTFSARQISNRFFHRFLKKICYFHDFGVFVKTLTSCRVACKTHGFGRVGNDDKMCNSKLFCSVMFTKSGAEMKET